MRNINRRDFLGNMLMVTGAAPVLAAQRIESPSNLPSAGVLVSTSGTPPKKPLVVDVHVHMSDPVDQERRKAYRDLLFKPFHAVYDGNGNRLLNPKKYSYLPEEIIQRMNEGGIDVSFVMIGGSKRLTPTGGANYEFLAEQVKKYPDRLVGIPMYDPLEEEWGGPEFVDYVHKHGFKGIKLLPVYDKYNPYDERLWPVYEKAIERDIVLVFHTGWGPAPTTPIKWAREELEGLDLVGIRYPELKVHLAHVGGPAQWAEAVLVAAKHENFSVDFSSWCAYPPQQLIAMLALARDVGLMDRMMFGSEHSICDSSMFASQIRNINLWADRLYYARFTDEEIAKILGLNACRKWNLIPSPRV